MWHYRDNGCVFLYEGLKHCNLDVIWERFVFVDIAVGFVDRLKRTEGNYDYNLLAVIVP